MHMLIVWEAFNLKRSALPKNGAINALESSYISVGFVAWVCWGKIIIEKYKKTLSLRGYVDVCSVGLGEGGTRVRGVQL